jgi:hypothetical protein
MRIEDHGEIDEKIRFQHLLAEHALQFADLFAQFTLPGVCGRIVPIVGRFHRSAPLVQLRPMNPQLRRQFTYVPAGLHPLQSELPKSRRILVNLLLSTHFTAPLAASVATATVSF